MCKDLSSKLKQCKIITKNEDRENFEVEIEKIIEESIKKYNEFYKKYMEINQKKAEIDNYSMKAIIQELVPPQEDIYPKEEYPLFNYFILTKYRTREDFIKRLGPKVNYMVK